MILRVIAGGAVPPPAHPLLYIRSMRKALLLAVLLLMPACVVGSDGQTPPAGDDDPGPGPDPDPSGGISGNITSATTFSGTVKFTGPTTIDPGIIVTVTAGTSLDFGNASNLTIKGTLDIQGTKAAPVTVQPDAAATPPATFFGGISVGTGGTLTMSYGVQHGGSIVTNPSSTTTITDSKMFGVSGDFLIMNGGTVNVTYSQLGADAGITDKIGRASCRERV